MKPFLVVGRLLIVCLLLAQTRWIAEGNQGSGGVPKRFLGENSKEANAAGASESQQKGAQDKNGVDDADKETIAQRLDEALKQEFHEEEDKKGDEGKLYNETAKTGEATTETVLLISQKKSGNHTESDSKPGASLPEKEDSKQDDADKHDMVVETDVDRIIDSHDNEYVLSKPNEEGSMGLNLDPQFVRDLTVVIAASAVAGFVMEALGQPTINGYFIAGSLVGPGGLRLIKELVQVQSMAQLGVQLLLFSLGLEFSLSRLKSMGKVAILGGLMQIALLSSLSSVGALFIGAPPSQGAFLGALVSMSSTSIVVKCLNDAKVQGQLSGQITIAILVLQDCVVGLFFALMPVLSSTNDGSGVSAAMVATVLGRVGLMLGVTVGAAVLIAFTVLPLFTRLLSRHASAETYQLLAISFCLLTSLATAKMGVSSELGAFVAGVMLGATDQQERMLHHLEPITHFFVALFIASIGLILSPVFLLNHIAVLASGVVVVIAAKIVLFGGVVWLFRYPAVTSLAVGINLAQIGEFGFVLLSAAHQYELVPSQVYMLLMGITALSLLVTPLLMQLGFRLVPGPLQRGASLMEMASLKKRLQGAGGDKSLPPSPPGSGSGDVLLMLSSATGQELGHREEEPYSPMEGDKGQGVSQASSPTSGGYTRGVPHGKGPLPGEAGYTTGTARHHSAPAKTAAPPQTEPPPAAAPQQEGQQHGWW